MRLFETGRADGRSDRRVLYDLARAASPETLFSYADLIAELQHGLDRPVTRARAYKAVREANKSLLREDNRYLGVVKNVGYRMLRADEHLPVALARRESAEKQLARGVEILRNARLDEMDEPHRSLHLGHLAIASGLHGMVVAATRRQQRQERAIDELRRQQEQTDRKVVLLLEQQRAAGAETAIR